MLDVDKLSCILSLLSFFFFCKVKADWVFTKHRRINTYSFRSSSRISAADGRDRFESAIHVK